jgi:hypothetical protein
MFHCSFSTFVIHFAGLIAFLCLFSLKNNREIQSNVIYLRLTIILYFILTFYAIFCLLLIFYLPSFLSYFPQLKLKENYFYGTNYLATFCSVDDDGYKRALISLEM